MIRHTPTTATGSDGPYECTSCGSRIAAERSASACSDCGGTLRNIAVARE